MASNIDTSNIDKQYPQAGVDNSTQGFRDNFEQIATNLDTAKTELEDLQENTARTDQATNFNSNPLFNADLIGVTASVFETGNTTADAVVNFGNGHYQTIAVGNDINIELIGWPDTGRFAKLKLALVSDGVARSVTFTGGGTATIKRNTGVPVQLYDSTDGSNFNLQAFPEILEVPNNEDPVIVEFWTINGGDTIFANFVGQFI